MLPFNECLFNAELGRLRKQFLTELPQRLKNIQQALDSSLMVSYPSSVLIDELHRLAGAAGSLGFTELGNTARELERLMSASIVDTKVWDDFYAAYSNAREKITETPL